MWRGTTPLMRTILLLAPYPNCCFILDKVLNHVTLAPVGDAVVGAATAKTKKNSSVFKPTIPTS